MVDYSSFQLLSHFALWKNDLIEFFRVVRYKPLVRIPIKQQTISNAKTISAHLVCVQLNRGFRHMRGGYSLGARVGSIINFVDVCTIEPL